MDERLKVAVSAVLIAAMFAFGAGGNWLVFLLLAAMAVIVSWEFSLSADEKPPPAFDCCDIHLGWCCFG